MPGVERQPRPHDTSDRHPRRNVVLGSIAGLALTGTVFGGAVMLAEYLKVDPDFIIEGDVVNDGNPTTIQGAVYLRCSENGADNAITFAKVKTVADDTTDGLPARGRNYEVQFETNEDRCNDALVVTRTDPQAVIDAWQEKATGWEENVHGGNFSSGEYFAEQIAEDKAMGVPVVTIDPAQ